MTEALIVGMHVLLAVCGLAVTVGLGFEKLDRADFAFTWMDRGWRLASPDLVRFRRRAGTDIGSAITLLTYGLIVSTLAGIILLAMHLTDVAFLWLGAAILYVAPLLQGLDQRHDFIHRRPPYNRFHRAEPDTRHLTERII